MTIPNIGSLDPGTNGTTVTLDIQNPPVIPCEDRCLELLKEFKKEMFGGSNTYSIGIWMSRDD